MKPIEIIQSLVNQFGEQYDITALQQIITKVENVTNGCISRIEKDATIITAWEKCMLDDLKELKAFFSVKK
jgi:hypothetical protein